MVVAMASISVSKAGIAVDVLTILGVIALMGLTCLWLLFALRDRPVDRPAQNLAVESVQAD
jgi:hypothetical protein